MKSLRITEHCSDSGLPGSRTGSIGLNSLDSIFFLTTVRFLVTTDGGGGEMLTKSCIILFGRLDEVEVGLQIEIRLGISGGSVTGLSILASI